MEHPSSPAAPQGPTDSMTSATTLPEESLSSETSQQEALEADQHGGITDSGSTDATNAVDDSGVSDKELPAADVPDIIVEPAETPASSDEVDTFHAIVDSATSAVTHVSEEVASALGYVSSGISFMFSSTPHHSTENVHVLDATEQPPTTSAIEPIVAEAPPDSTQGVPSPDAIDATPQIAPVVPILILPVNDHMLNESASPLPDGESVESDPLVPGSFDATISVLEPSTHSPLLLSKSVPSVTQEAQAGGEQNGKPTEEEKLGTQAAEEHNGELLVDAIAPPSDAAANPTTPDINVNPDPVKTIDTSVVDAGPIAPDNELSLPTPEPQDTPAVTASSMPSTDSDTKDSKDISFPASTTTDSPVTLSSKFNTASPRKKRRSFFAKLKEFFSHKEKTKK
ncbi:hypothetical protein DEU56DRAFT_784016 [Suillus clintonianus]|uniref:uncharacterized protein n=1 Tax=Suillus clintonianus TaxID=1904413 RepID=UPI001B86B112|nr:uncharacterized protein DEU56DRAFT_784016 [Suillus clintonianus]KAG2148079.1 hypothetical protein DEU56DRAFT_784016 [Suillus clintonianus]